MFEPKAHEYWIRDKNQLLTFRLVSKTWKHGFDSFYQQPGNRHVFTQKFHYGVLFGISKPERYISRDFLQHFETTHQPATDANPFFSKTVKIIGESGGYLDPNDPDINVDLSAFTTEVFEKYGHHVQYLDIESLEELFYEFGEILENMPNLKELKCNAEHGMNLCHKWGGAQFPELTQLESISTSSMPYPIFTGLLYPNSHISKLCIDDCGNTLLRNYGLHRMDLKNLKSLELHLTETEIMDLDQPEINWQLETLSVELRDDRHLKNPEKFFELVKRKWGKSVKHFNLTTSRKSLPSLELDKLETLTVSFSGYCSLDFILPTKDTLQYLLVDFGRMEHGNKGQDLKLEKENALREEKSIKILEHLKSPLESNIWQFFPRLKLVQCSDKWEQFHAVTRNVSDFEKKKGAGMSSKN